MSSGPSTSTATAEGHERHVVTVVASGICSAGVNACCCFQLRYTSVCGSRTSFKLLLVLRADSRFIGPSSDRDDDTDTGEGRYFSKRSRGMLNKAAFMRRLNSAWRGVSSDAAASGAVNHHPWRRCQCCCCRACVADELRPCIPFGASRQLRCWHDTSPYSSRSDSG